MEETGNMTRGTFILLGFPSCRPLQILLFFIFFLAYILTIMEHLFVIVILWTNSRLHKPMYFFLGHLSFLELWYTTVTIPKLLSVLLVESGQISLPACMSQLFFFISLVCTECVLLAVMAFDRFVAICKPMHYITIMRWRLCFILVSGSWLTGFLISFIKVYYIARLKFCHSGVINHFFCDISPLLNMSCTDIKVTELVDFILALIILLLPLLLTVISYVCILITIIQMPTSSGRYKAFSTCASHLTVVIIFYTATLFMYARPSRAQALNYTKFVSVIYTVITPFLNPIIYCLRNKDVKHFLFKTINW
uniref:Olfactory receptor n=1 Tax=Xenopus tropicalis TaxID=8364 RepID=A0A6I8PKM4_XENTR